MPRIAYVNGQYVPHDAATVHIEDRGFQFADSAYEVIALMHGALVDARGHIDRLQRTLGELRMGMPVARQTLMLLMRELVRRNRIDCGGLYIQVTRGVAPRDFNFPKGDVPLSLVMTLRPATFDIAARKAAMKKVITLPDIRWQRRDIKSTALLAQVLTRQLATDAGAQEAWMVDDKGLITEGSSSNAWIVDKKGQLITRQTAGNAILKGVTRSALQALCKKEGIKIVERAFSVKEAHAAIEAFCSSAVALISPVSSIDGHKIGSGRIGPITEKIFDLYVDYATRNTEKHFSWHER